MSPSRFSLKRQLLLWLLLPQVVLWLAGAVFSYRLAGRYANEAVDATLLQATRSLARQVKPMGNGLLIDFPRAAQDVLEADPSDKLLYTVSSPPGQFILGNRNLPSPPAMPASPPLGQAQFYDGEIESDGARAVSPVRVAALYLQFGENPRAQQTMLVQVARSSANRELLARRLLIDTMLPLSVLIVLMSMIVWAGVGAGLAPIARLRRLVEGRKPNDLRPIELDAAPQELRSLAQAINDLLEAVSHNVEAQRRFISDAAHQLRTPLAGLKSQSELALAEAPPGPLTMRLARVHEGASRSAHLVNQLLALARTEPESLQRQTPVRFDLGRLAREVTAELVPRALQQNVDLGYDGPDSDPECTSPSQLDDRHGAGPETDDADGAPGRPVAVVGIPLLLREALVNLIDNALRYAGRGARVTVQVHEAGDHAELVVTDNGPGVPEALREQVFERFFRATHEGNGCGLGLAIVKEIVERHGGRIGLSTARPRGLRVSIQLPLAA
ncbi:sensor histidine kinase [Mitsuaria sp. BK037]|uniref:sensor histidine kinase n=1 Tax=Mitsuaria sp. BK037 TaxID=2587122 RepID=UPI00162128D5|nr:sensor histidine kinase [Mitsuaria sp. BK037]MBB3280671.1 two-component system sensor histidine kinase TctE [Mitsuaria sp. BK037]